MQNVPSQTPEVKLYTQQEVDAIVAETIEACAKVCEAKAEAMAVFGGNCDPDDLAAAIRSMK